MDIALFLGSLFGAALLWGLFCSAVRRKGAPFPLLVLIAAGALCYSGVALRLLIGWTFPGSRAISYAGKVAVLGLSFLPSSILAAILAFSAERGIPFASRLQRYLVLLMTLPGLFAFFFGGTDPLTLQVTIPFSLYTTLVLILSALLYLRLATLSEMAVHRRFYRLIAGVITGFVILNIIIYPLGAIRHPRIGPILLLLLVLFPVVPAVIFGYFVYRYSFFKIVIRPGLLYSAMTGTVLTVYLLGIRRLVEELRETGGGFRPDIIEAVLITVLIFLFQPVKNRGQRFINRLFFKERYEYQHLLRELSQTLNIPLDLDKRLSTVVDAIGATLNVQVVSLVLFDREDTQIRNVSVIASHGLPGFPPPAVPFGRGMEDYAHIEQVAEWFSTQRRPLDIGELHRRTSVTSLIVQGVQLCLPVLREERLIGFLGLSQKKGGVPFSTEERELLGTLCNQIALAVENAHLIEQRLEMERRMYRAERLSSLGLLSASIAHEVKNPLSSIKAIVSVLREDLQGDTTKVEDLSVILSEIDRLRRVVDQLLTFARPDQEKAPCTVTLKEVLDGTILVLSHEAERWGVVIRSEVEESTTISGDLDDLKEILFNLILNGIQAMPEGGTLTITANPTTCPAAPHPPV
ncbi:MAG: GAF domain-containing protein, partial [Candidatus Latescibacteria bacterium]|nr:GAF domain-containing protein [Candidatus Latescibacterota bacterium]